MKLIVISNPESISNEIEHIITMFDLGLNYFHLRKPHFDIEQMSKIIDQIPEQYRRNIVVHSCYDLLERYDLKGIHFTGSAKSNIDNYLTYKCHKSLSCHSIEELKQYKNLDYKFISPVFPSISKQGYENIHLKSEIRTYISHKLNSSPLIALGGVDINNIAEVQSMKFDGAAVLGILWNTPEKAIQTFKLLQEKCKT